MINWFKFIGVRGSGKTTLLIDVCKKLDATLVCADRQQESMVKRQYPKTATINDNFIAKRGDYIFDHYAVDRLSVGYENQIEQLQSKLAECEEENKLLRERYWLLHDCNSIAALYGDDGEMSCGICGLDFKRQPVKKIIEILKNKALTALKKQGE